MKSLIAILLVSSTSFAANLADQDLTGTQAGLIYGTLVNQIAVSKCDTTSAFASGVERQDDNGRVYLLTPVSGFPIVVRMIPAESYGMRITSVSCDGSESL